MQVKALEKAFELTLSVVFSVWICLFHTSILTGSDEEPVNQLCWRAGLHSTFSCSLTGPSPAQTHVSSLNLESSFILNVHRFHFQMSPAKLESSLSTHVINKVAESNSISDERNDGQSCERFSLHFSCSVTGCGRTIFSILTSEFNSGGKWRCHLTNSRTFSVAEWKKKPNLTMLHL